MQIGSFVNNVSSSFLPIFEKMQVVIAEKIEKIVEKFDGMDGVAVEVQNRIIEFAAKSIIALGNFGDTLFNIFQQSKIKVLELQRAFLDAAKTILIIAGKFADTTAEIQLLNGVILDNALRTFDAEHAISNYGEAATIVANKLRKYKVDLGDVRDGQNAFTKALVKSNDELDRVSPINAFKDQLKEVDKTFDTIAVNSMKKFEDSIIAGLKSGKLAFKDFADYVIEQLLRVAIQQLITAQLIDPFRTFLSGFDLFSTPSQDNPQLSNFMDSLPTGDNFFKSNNEGGGFTGQGIRAGGLDNKGGFPAILHPNETVIDHTKGQSMQSAPTVNFNISTVDAAGFDELLASRKGLITSIINNAMNNRGRMGVT